jgi:DNA-binding transcriptional regulator YiaG
MGYFKTLHISFFLIQSNYFIILCKVKLKGVVYLEVENSKKIEEQNEENLVKKTCEKLGINQKQLAEKTGLSVQTISRWSQDNSKISKNGEKTFDILLQLEACKNAYFKAIN